MHSPYCGKTAASTFLLAILSLQQFFFAAAVAPDQVPLCGKQANNAPCPIATDCCSTQGWVSKASPDHY